jgi:hypothetical protein
MNRVIRLKEWGCNKKTTKKPAHNQIQNATRALETKDYALNTDSNGFIVNGSKNGENARTKNIVLLGDSFIESLFVDEDKRINAILEKQFTDFNVLNGGYSGATSLHLLNVINNKVIPLNPNLVIFFVPTNDQRIRAVENGYWNKDQRLSSVIPSGKGLELVDDYPETSFCSSVEKMLEVIHFTLSNYGIKHCFATTPHRQKLDEDDEWFRLKSINFKSYGAKVSQRKQVNNVCRAFCQEKNLSLIDLEAELSDFNHYFYDDLHLTNQSSPIVGDIISDRLKSLDIL